MVPSRLKTKGRSETRPFIQLYTDVLNHPNYVKLSARAVKLLVDLSSQYNGRNNGDLSACMALMKKRGWNSNANLSLALKELIYYGFVLQSRQGGRNRPSLHAVSFYAIDECKGKHDLRVTAAAPNNYKTTKKKWVPKRQCRKVDPQNHDP